MKRTFVDAGVLIAVAPGGNVQAVRAMEILDDTEREFAASVFLQLEVLPQAVFNKRVAEAAFYDAFFSTVTHWATNLDDVTSIAMREASINRVEAMDALHVAAAASVGASELITTEKPSRSIPSGEGRQGRDDSSRRLNVSANDKTPGCRQRRGKIHSSHEDAPRLRC